MAEDFDSDFDEQSLNDGETITLEVETDDVDVSNVVLYIDNGTSGTAPSTYDLETEVHRQNPDPADWFFYAEQLATTSRSWTDPAYSQKMRYTITNSSGGAATFRANLVAYKGGD